MKRILIAGLLVGVVFLSGPVRAEKITVAAAADLKFAMDEVVSQFQRANPKDQVDMIYGSSGKLLAQIRQGAPFDLFFSADINFPRELVTAGLAASEVKPYALGRIVLWGAAMDASKMTLENLLSDRITRIAIANPKHAPYGKRAEEALRKTGLWDKVEHKLVYGENIAQTAQFVESGNAQIGVVALSLVMSPALANKGGYGLIPENLHQPLEQGYVITKRAEGNPLAKRFAAYVGSTEVRAVMEKYGFVLPGAGEVNAHKSVAIKRNRDQKP